MQTLFEVLSNGERLILAANHNTFVTWNQSSTFQMWQRAYSARKVYEMTTYEEIDIRTYTEIHQMSMEVALVRAKEWLSEVSLVFI